MRLVGALLCLGLFQRRLERRRINLRQEFAFLDVLPFRKGDFHDLAIHPGMNRHGIERLDRSQPIQIDGDVLLFHRSRHHRHREPAAASPAAR